MSEEEFIVNLGLRPGSPLGEKNCGSEKVDNFIQTNNGGADGGGLCGRVF